ncbi:MAG TPA: Franean1_4349 family RiPP [Anaerolineae bacterium]|nr:Franean1_4349 family RiPP [Anaerolineae bacterium]
MAQKELERLVGRAILDLKFRERLFADPEKAIREEGFDLTEDEMATLRRIDREKAKSAVEALDAVAGQPWT